MKHAWLWAGMFMIFAASGEAAPCGSALLLEVAAPAVFDAVDPSQPITARFWEAGAGGSHSSDDGCAAGCTLASGAACESGGDCLALTGVSWLNAACATAGHLPQRTVFLIEQTTEDAGGRWAAIDLDTNASDANTDLDAKAAAVCSGCASVVSPYLGGFGRPAVTGAVFTSGVLTATLAWSAPSAFAQALSNAPDLVTSYAVFYRIHTGPPPPATGDPTGWTLAADLESDGAANGGFSTNLTAEVEVDVDVPATATHVTFAVGLNFDGSGNPTADPDTRPATFLSDQSEAVLGPLLFADGFESGDVSAWSGAVP